MTDNIFKNLTEEERTLAWMYIIFNKDNIKAKTEQWTKEAEEAGMTLDEYTRRNGKVAYYTNRYGCSLV